MASVRHILIGGTKNMGTDVNVQEAHCCYAPCRCTLDTSDRKQREGRGVQSKWCARDFSLMTMNVYFYATEGSLDMYKYQLQETKGKLFAQFKSGTIGDPYILMRVMHRGWFWPCRGCLLCFQVILSLWKSQARQKVERTTSCQRGSLWEVIGSVGTLVMRNYKQEEEYEPIIFECQRCARIGTWWLPQQMQKVNTHQQSVKDDYSSRKIAREAEKRLVLIFMNCWNKNREYSCRVSTSC